MPLGIADFPWVFLVPNNAVGFRRGASVELELRVWKHRATSQAGLGAALHLPTWRRARHQWIH